MFELQVLGVGGGASQVYHKECSSSLLLLRNGQPWALIDLGLGVVDALHGQGRGVPERLVITHNHSDHAGELPVVLRVEHAAGRRLQVLAETGVCQRLIEHRMAEHAQLIEIQKLADWRAVDAGEQMDLGDDLTLEWLATQHSERCAGLLLYQGGEALLGYSADSGEFPALYQRLCEAPTVIFDAREQGNDWHAGFDQIQPWLQSGRYLIGHGIASNQIDNYRYRGQPLPLLRPGQRLTLGGQAEDSNRSSASGIQIAKTVETAIDKIYWLSPYRWADHYLKGCEQQHEQDPPQKKHWRDRRLLLSERYICYWLAAAVVLFMFHPLLATLGYWLMVPLLLRVFGILNKELGVALFNRCKISDGPRVAATGRTIVLALINYLTALFLMAICYALQGAASFKEVPGYQVNGVELWPLIQATKMHFSLSEAFAPLNASGWLLTLFHSGFCFLFGTLVISLFVSLLNVKPERQ